MAKKDKQTRTLALKIGHPTVFRQTVDVGTAKTPKRHQLVFTPGEDKEVTQAEIDGGLQPFIDSGLLVDPNRDVKGRQRRPTPAEPDAQKKIDELERRVEDLAGDNARLQSELDAANALLAGAETADEAAQAES